MLHDVRAGNKIDAWAETARAAEPLKALLEAGFDAMAIFAGEGARLVAANRAFARLFAIDPAQAAGRRLAELGIADDAQATALAARLSAGGRVRGARTHLRARDGRRMIALIGAGRIELAGRDAVAVTFRDGGRGRAARARFRAAAQAAGRLKTAFIANLSHEIRTPLNVILGYGELLAEHLEEIGDASQSDALEALQRAGRRLGETIGEILDYARLQAGALELRPAAIELGPLIAAACAEARPAAAARGLRLVLEDAAPGAIVRCDRYCLEAAIAALLRNAIKFTERGWVAVRIERDAAGALELAIADTGVGIGADYLARLFEPFSQEQASASRRFEGVGLGLTLAYRLIALNGGRLTVHSVKGRGATVTIRFAEAAGRG